MKRPLLSLLLTSILTFHIGCFAQEAASTLAKIKQSGTITLGVRESSAPFSFVESGQKDAKGYSIDICMKVVDAIRKEIKKPNLEVTQVVVTPANRIPKLLEGSIDLECGSTTNTRSRQEQVAFSYTMFTTGTRFLVKKSSRIQSVQDLKGKVVVSTAGTNNEQVVSSANSVHSHGFIMASAKDHAEAFAQVQSGSAAAFAMADILLAGLISRSQAPDDYEVIGKYMSIDPYAMMFRKNDAQFMKLVDSVLVGLFHSGEITSLYKKWFLTKELNFPMSLLMRESIKTPTKEPAWP